MHVDVSLNRNIIWKVHISFFRGIDVLDPADCWLGYKWINLFPKNSNYNPIFLPDEFLLQITGVKMHGLQQIIFAIKM